jgi:hypothetical protein
MGRHYSLDSFKGRISAEFDAGYHLLRDEYRGPTADILFDEVCKDFAKAGTKYQLPPERLAEKVMRFFVIQIEAKRKGKAQTPH